MTADLGRDVRWQPGADGIGDEESSIVGAPLQWLASGGDLGGLRRSNEALPNVAAGLQAERVAEYFNHIGYHLLLDLVGLLEDVSGTKAEGKAVELLVHMHLPPGGDESTKQP